MIYSKAWTAITERFNWRLFYQRGEGMKVGRYVIPIYGVLLILVVYGSVGKQISIWDLSGIPYSVADCLVIICQPYIMGIFYIPLTIGLMIKNEDSLLKKVFIVPYVNRKNIWRHQCKRVMVNAIYYSVYLTVVSVIVSALSSLQWMNWGSQYSLYYVLLKDVFSGTFISILLMFFYFAWFKTVFMSLILMCVEWFGRKRIYGWLVFIAITIIEWYFSEATIYYRLFSVYYSNFRYTYGMAAIIILSFLLLAAIYKVGRIGLERREIYFE